MSTTSFPDRRIVFHLGVQKTGSTSFHNFLRRNAERLAGRLFVRTPVQGTPTQRMGRAAINLSLDPSRANTAALARLARDVRAEIDTSDLPVLISHENLPGAMLGKEGETRLYPQIERIIGVLLDSFAPYAPRFALYTREMAAWKRSVYNQAVKTDGYTKSAEAFFEETSGCGTWAELEARVKATAGADNVAVFALEAEPDASRPGQQVLAYAGLSPQDIAALDPVDRRANQSLNAGALEFMRQINGLDLAPEARRMVMQQVKRHPHLFADAPSIVTEAGK